VTEPRKLAAELKEGAPRRAPQRLNGERKPTIEASSHRGTPQHWRPAHMGLYGPGGRWSVLGLHTGL